MVLFGFEHYPNLKRLLLNNVMFDDPSSSDVFFGKLFSFKNLTHLAIINCKIETFTVKKFSENFNLQGLEHITFIGSSDIVNDTFLKMLAEHCSNLETLNLEGNKKITSTGVNNLLNSKCGRECLRFVNLDYCPLIDHSICDYLENRSTDAPELTIFAYQTDILANLYDVFFQCRVIVENEAEKTKFFWAI